MAGKSKVNVKFVIILVVVLIGLVGAGAGVLLFVTGRSGDQLMSKGDAAMAKNDFVAAEKMYSRAVNKDPNNVEWLTKWESALIKTTPALQNEYDQEYFQNLRGLRRNLALMQRGNVKAQHNFLSMFYGDMELTPVSKPAYDNLIQETEAALKDLEAAKPAGEGRDNWQTIKRYRGLARVKMAGEAGDTQTPEQLEQAKADLKAALAADPTDEESFAGLIGLVTGLADRARVRNDSDKAAQLQTEARELINERRAKVPDSPIAALLDVSLLGLEARSRGVELAKTQPKEAETKFRAEIEALKPKLDEVAALFSKAPRESISVTSLLRYQTIESTLDPASQGARTSALLEERIKADPSDHLSRFQRALLLGDRGDNTAAIDELQAIVDQPMPPLSLRGVLLHGRRAQAGILQARNYLAIWEREKDDTKKSALLENAKKSRERAAQVSSADNPQLLYVDGLLALAAGDRQQGKRLLTDYLRRVNESDPDATRQLARVHVDLNELGEAERRLQSLVASAVSTPTDVFVLAQVKRGLRKPDEALELASRLVEIDPNNAGVKDLIRQIRVDQGQADTGDPIADKMARANRLIDEQKSDEAAKLLVEAARESGFDRPVTVAAAYRLVQNNDKPGAVAILKEAAAAKPDVVEYRQLTVALEEPDEYKGRMMVLDLAQLSDADRLVAKYQTARNYGKKEEAAALLADLKTKHSDNPGAIEQMFLAALEAKEYAEAQRLADAAKQRDLDKVGGRTFQSRLLFAQDKLSEAIAMMQTAAADGAMGPEGWRLLGEMQRRAGRGNDAVTSYKRGLAIRPNDPPGILAYIRTLAVLGRNEEALNEARAMERFGRIDPEFTDLLLNLEGAFGNKAAAIEARQKIKQRDPSNRGNNFQIASLLVETQRFKEARDAIAELKKTAGDELDLVALEARWYADQGDLAGARRQFAEYIANLPRAQMDSTPYLVLSAFMLNRNMEDVGMMSLLQAREYQDPKQLEVEKQIADVLTRRERITEAVESARKVVVGGADTSDHAYRKRLIEGLSRLKKFDEAQKLIDELGPAALDRDVVMRLLAADVARGLGDEAKLRDIMDRTKQSFPGDAMVWIKSGQLNIDKGLNQDALEDLNKSLQIDPRLWQAYRLRGQLHARMGQMDEALKDMQESVRLNPGLKELRVSLMNELIRRGRESDAVTVGEEAVKARPGDVQLMVDLGEVFVTAGKWTSASTFYKKAFDQSKLPVVVQRYLDTLLNSTPPNLSDMEAVLRTVQNDIEANAGLLMARAGLLQRRNREADAMRDLQRSLKLISAQNVNEITNWFDRFAWVYTSPADQLAKLELLERDGILADWLRYFRVIVLVGQNEEAKTRQALTLLDRVLTSTDTLVLQTAFRQQASILYGLKDWDATVQSLRKCLEKFPDDWEQTNNLASVLAEYKRQYAEALPIAERSVQLVQAARVRAAHPYDTLGATLVGLNQPDKAIEALRAGLSIADIGPARFSILVNLARAHTLKGEKTEAQAAITDADSLIKSFGEVIGSEEIRAKLAEVKQQNGVR